MIELEARVLSWRTWAPLAAGIIVALSARTSPPALAGAAVAAVMARRRRLHADADGISDGRRRLATFDGAHRVVLAWPGLIRIASAGGCVTLLLRSAAQRDALAELSCARLVPSIVARVARGEIVRFGDVSLGARTLAVRGRRLALDDVSSLAVEGGRLRVAVRVGRDPAPVPVARVANLRALLVLWEGMFSRYSLEPRRSVTHRDGRASARTR